MKNQIRVLVTALSLLLLIGLVAACKKDPDPVTAKSSAKTLSSFTFGSLNPAIVGSVSGNTVMATVPFGTNVTALAPTIVVSDKATVSPASGVAQNFSNSVNYTVTAEDGTTQVYAVAVGVGVAPKSPAKDITAFAFNGLTPAVNCTINATTKVISGTLPASADLTKLVPTLTLSPKATVTPPTGVTQDFSKAVVYTVTAEDGTTQVYTANVTKGAVVVVDFLWDYTKTPTIEKPNPTTLLIKGITVKSAPTLSATRTYWYSYYHPVKRQTIYVGSLREASDFSFNIEVKDLLPNRTYDIKYQIASYDCDASKDGPTCHKNTSISFVPKNNDEKRNVITAKTSDFPDNSDKTINSFRDVRIFISKTAPSLDDSCLVDLKNGKVYPLKDGAKNASNIDMSFQMIDINDKWSTNMLFHSADYYRITRSILNTIINNQKWSSYRRTEIEFGANLNPASSSYPYTWAGGWHNIIDAESLAKFKFSSDYLESRVFVAETTPLNFVRERDLFLLGFKTQEGKVGVIRLKDLIETSTGYLLIVDIKSPK